MDTGIKNFFNLSLFTIVICMATCMSKKEDLSAEASVVMKAQNDEKFHNTNLQYDVDFATGAARASLLEIRLGQLASERSASAEVKSLGKQLADKHSRTAEHLKAIASDAGISTPISLSESGKRKYNALTNKHGKAFDKAYLAFIVTDQQAYIDACKREMTKGKVKALQSWASENLPEFNKQLTLAQRAANGPLAQAD